MQLVSVFLEDVGCFSNGKLHPSEAVFFLVQSIEGLEARDGLEGAHC